MKTIAIIAQKGGVGKTTLTINLSIAAQRAGMATAVLDLDPQQSTAKWHKSLRAEEAPAFAPSTAQSIKRKLDLLRGNGADIVFIDTPPASDAAALAAAKAADLVLIPVTPKYLALRALAETLQLVKDAGKPAMVVLNFMPPKNMFTRRNDAMKAAASFGLPVCQASIVNRVAFDDALREGHSVMEYEPNGGAARDLMRVFDEVCYHVNMQAK